MIMGVGLTASTIGRGQRSEVSGHNEMDYNLLTMQSRHTELNVYLMADIRAYFIEIFSVR